MLPDHLRMSSLAPSRPELTFTDGQYRISVITDGIIRCEWSQSGAFEDRASQVVLARDLGPVDCEVLDEPDQLIIRTARLDFRYNKKEFSPGGLHATIRNVPTHHAVWRVGQPPAASLPAWWRNYGGTVRTLDDVDGEVDLGFGFNSFVGYGELDDTQSLVFDDSGWVAPREPQASGDHDVYVIGYGDDHQLAIQDMYRLTGSTPLLPRWALGNWWSRYHAYSATEYIAMLNDFKRNEIPLSVAILDMDWHQTDIEPSLGTGWTGYSWDTNLFPDPEGFLGQVKSEGLAVGVNLHPADGVRNHEDCYGELSASLGHDPGTGEPVRFNAASPSFWDNYFKHALHPLERQGVDFWWVDWQQGTWSEMPGLDPLWALNHLHYLDSARPDPSGKCSSRRGLTFSRYSGVGSHRYPIGFSGDTVMSWASLEFQPKFTATAANVAYGWWSHDIGGHLAGTTDPHLYARWVQLGCFSPILRLHSTKSDEIRREPWLFDPQVSTVVTRFLQLRHQLVPYLYCMNVRSHRDGIPVVTPMYWSHPRNMEALTNRGQFWFGSELLVVPIVTPLDIDTRMGHTQGYLPDGIWVDVLTGTVYDGGRVVTFCRHLDSYPVLAKAGTILPMADQSEAQRFGTDNPARLELRVAAGDSGTFTLVEDDDSADPTFATTRFDWDWPSKTLTISPAEGSLDCLPNERHYQLTIVGITSDDPRNSVQIDVGPVSTTAGTVVNVSDKCPDCLSDNSAQLAQRVFDLPMPVLTKKALNALLGEGTTARQAARLLNLDLPESTKSAVIELLTARVD